MKRPKRIAFVWLASMTPLFAEESGVVTTPPTDLGLPSFYKKYVSANGYPIVSSEKVDDYALKEAAYLINMMLANRPDVRDAMEAGLWEGKYASVNHSEYFAEGVQSWFDNNRQPDHDHNHVDTRVELREYDSGLAALCEEVFGDTELVYTKPATRLHGHLDGYDPSKAPKFAWPESLLETKRAIREEAEARNKEHRKKCVN